MSTTTLIKTTAIAAITFAALATTAQAQSRYGDITAYEGSGQCAPGACATATTTTTVQSSRYGSVETVAPTYNSAPVVVDCLQFAQPGCAPVMTQPTTVYTQPYAQAQVQTYQEPSVQMYEQAAPVNCPAGTTAQPDGTCLQGSSYSTTTSTYSAPVQMAEPVNCPAGTTAQPDGTCMQTSTYSQPTMTDCPSGMTRQADGSCASIYMGDATPSYGYDSDGSYGRDTYLPIRK